MKTFKILAAVAVFLLLGLAVGYYVLPRPVVSPNNTSAKPAGFAHYTNSQFGLELYYPDQAQLITDKNQMATSGYIPACDPTAAFACFLYAPAQIFSKTNFESAGVALNYYSDRTDENACLALANGEMQQTIETMNGLKFSVASFGDAAVGHQSNGVNYRTFQAGNCLELAKRINTTTFENYPAGAIERFTDADRQLLDNAFNDVVASFKFVAAQ